MPPDACDRNLCEARKAKTISELLPDLGQLRLIQGDVGAPAIIRATGKDLVAPGAVFFHRGFDLGCSLSQCRAFCQYLQMSESYDSADRF